MDQIQDGHSPLLSGLFIASNPKFNFRKHDCYMEWICMVDSWYLAYHLDPFLLTTPPPPPPYGMEMVIRHSDSIDLSVMAEDGKAIPKRVYFEFCILQ
jgi:hypothetical protein